MKWTLKPAPNLELGFSRTVIFGGPGFPVTFGSFLRSIFSTQSGNFSANDPGDRRAGFDFSYRIPGLRDWLTLYCDSFAEDEAFPPAYPTHSAWSPGLYLSKLPYLHKLDLRAEGAVTPEPALPRFLLLQRSLPRRLHQWPADHGQLGGSSRQRLSTCEHVLVLRYGTPCSLVIAACGWTTAFYREGGCATSARTPTWHWARTSHFRQGFNTNAGSSLCCHRGRSRM